LTGLEGNDNYHSEIPISLLENDGNLAVYSRGDDLAYQEYDASRLSPEVTGGESLEISSVSRTALPENRDGLA